MNSFENRVSHSLLCAFIFIFCFYSSYFILFIPNVIQLLRSDYAIPASLLCFTLPVSLISWYYYQKKSGLMPVGVTTWQIVFLLLLTAIGLSIISGFLGNEEEWIVLFKHINGFPFVLLSISIIFAAPISEEIMFRGFLLNASMWYGPNGKWIGILASSLIFSSLHTQYTSMSTFVYLFIAGIILCQIRIYTRSLIAPMILHMFINTISVICLL